MPPFDHEKLKVYDLAVEFVSWSETVIDKLPKSAAVRNQFDRARTSVPLNLAEGNGKYSPANRCRFFDIARGSALECAACLNAGVALRLISEDESEQGKELLRGIVSMIVGLIRKNSPDRMHEETVEYRVGTD